MTEIPYKTEKLMRELFLTLAPPPDLNLSEWADNYRRLSAESSVEPGRWRTSKAPYQREIMNAISDGSVAKVIIMSAAQIGKTDAFILNTIGYFMQYDPSPIMVMQPTITMGEAFSKDRLDPMLRDTPVLSKLSGFDEGDETKKKKSRSTVLQKKYPGGHITIVGANSPSSLASRPIRILLADEIDRYPITAGNEGDPLALAAKRQTTFWNRKTVCVSTPTIKNASRIEVEFEHSTMERWSLPCPECGEYQSLKWSGITFDKENLENIGYTCEHCGAMIDETEWKAVAERGKYIAENPNAKVRGFHLNALASLFVDWRDIVSEFLLANDELKKGNRELMKVWTNTVLGETWEDGGTGLDWEILLERRELYTAEVPDGVILLTAAVDTQDDRFELEVVGWGENMESWGIGYYKIYGDMDTSDPWERLDEALRRTYKNSNGKEFAIVSACIDSGGHYTNEVYRFAKEREKRHIYAIKGRPGDDIPFVKSPTRSNRVGAHLFVIGVDIGKSRLYARLNVEKAGAGYCHFPVNPECGYGEEYFIGLCSEKREIRYKNGRASYVWVVQKGHERNEPLDIRNYNTAAIEIYGVQNLVKIKPKVKKAARKQLSGGI